MPTVATTSTNSTAAFESASRDSAFTRAVGLGLPRLSRVNPYLGEIAPCTMSRDTVPVDHVDSKPNAFGCTAASVWAQYRKPSPSRRVQSAASLHDLSAIDCVAGLPRRLKQTKSNSPCKPQQEIRIESELNSRSGSIRHTVADDIGTVARAQQILNYIVLVGYRAR